MAKQPVETATAAEIRMLILNLIQDESRTPDPQGRADSTAKGHVSSIPPSQIQNFINAVVAEMLTKPESQQLNVGVILGVMNQLKGDFMEPIPEPPPGGGDDGTPP